MTRYERFLESINTPEKLIDVLEKEQCFEELLGKEFCNPKCEENTPESECRKCQLRYLNENIEVE